MSVSLFFKNSQNPGLYVRERIKKSPKDISSDLYRQYQWDNKTLYEKICFCLKTVATCGESYRKYVQAVNKDYLQRLQKESTNKNSFLTLAERILYPINSSSFKIADESFSFPLAGIIRVKKNGYVFVEMDNRLYQDIFNQLSIKTQRKIQFYPGSFLGGHVTVAWDFEGQRNKEYFKKLQGKIVLFDQASYHVHVNRLGQGIHTVQVAAKNLSKIREHAGLTSELRDRSQPKKIVPFHMTIGVG